MNGSATISFVDAIGEVTLHALRAISGVLVALPHAHESGGTRLEIELEPVDDALTRLLSIVTSDGVRVHNIRSLEPEPMDVFKHVTHGSSAP